MDTITHTVLGACAGELIAGKKLGKKAMLLGAIANNLADADVVTSFWMNPADTLLAHRGFTHSFLFVVVMTPVLGWLFQKIYRKEKISLKEWMMLAGVNLLLHAVIDTFAVYGTGWFEPFSHYRVAFNIFFIADPFYTIALLVSAIALLLLRRSSLKRKTWAKAGIYISTLYVLYAIYHKTEVDSIVKTSLEKKKIVYQNFLATPTPFNNFLWYVVARTDSGYQIGYYSVFDRSKDISFHFVSRNDSLLNTLKDRHDVNKLIRFAQGYGRVEKVNDEIVFNDMRFGQTGGWNNGDAPFVFQYSLAEHADNNMVIQRGRWKASGSGGLSAMIERIKGK